MAQSTAIFESALTEAIRVGYSKETIERTTFDSRRVTRMFFRGAKRLNNKRFHLTGQYWEGYMLKGTPVSFGPAVQTAGSTQGNLADAPDELPDDRYSIYCPYLYAPIRFSYEAMDLNDAAEAEQFVDTTKESLNATINGVENFTNYLLCTGGSNAYRVAVVSAGAGDRKTSVSGGIYDIPVNDTFRAVVGSVLDLYDSSGTLIAANVRVRSVSAFQGVGNVRIEHSTTISGTVDAGSGLWLPNSATYGSTSNKPVWGIRGSLQSSSESTYFLGNSGIALATNPQYQPSVINAADGSVIAWGTKCDSRHFDYVMDEAMKNPTADYALDDKGNINYLSYFLGRHNLLTALGQDARSHRRFQADVTMEDMGLKATVYNGVPYLADQDFASGELILFTKGSMYFGIRKAGEWLDNAKLSGVTTGTGNFARISGSVRYEGVMAWAFQAFHAHPRSCVVMTGLTT